MVHRWGAGALLLSLLVYGALVWTFRAFTPDDTLIYLRYAENAAAGRGLVFNVGERVNGATSVLWLSWLTVLAMAGAPLLAAAKVLGAVCGALTIWLTQRLALRFDARAAVAAPLVLVGFLDHAYWAVSGLDTAMTTAVFAAALLVTVRATEGHAGVIAGLAWGVAVAARPEGAALGVVALAWLLIRTRVSRSKMTAVIAAFALPVLVVLALLWFYYGDPLPNTYWAKRFDRVEALHRGLVYLRAFAMANDGALIALATVAACLLARGPVFWLVSSTLVTYVAYLLWSGGDSWASPGAFRFATLVLPPLAALMAAGLSAVWARTTGAASARVAAVASGVVLAVWLAFPSTGNMVVRRIGGDAGIVEYLRAHAGPDDAVAVNDVGWVGYEADVRVIDTFGLVDRWVAHSLRKRINAEYRPGEAERLVEYVLGRAPRWVILKGTQQPDGRMAIANETGAPVMYADPRFQARYAFIRAGASEPYLLFERR